MKKKGFTLVELVISMSLLSFVIMMASLLFDRAIQVTPKLRNTITNSSKAYSEVENMIFRVRKDASSFTTATEFLGLDIKVNGVEIRDVKGHLISYDGTQVQLDTGVSVNDQLFTFVGNGHRESPTVNMKNSLITTNSVRNRFRFFPVASPSIPVSFRHESENGANLKKIRSRVLRSTVAANSARFLHFPYVDTIEVPNTLGRILRYSGLYSPSESGFEYVGEAADGPDSTTIYNGTFTIAGHGDNKQEYYNSIDRSYAVGAFTLNKNGHIGPMITSLTNEVESEQDAVHLIGLPYISSLVGFYDYNLLIAPSKSKANTFYSLYNPTAAADTAYDYSNPNALISPIGSDYQINWGNRDVRNILSPSTSASKLLVNKGLIHKDTIDLIIEGATIQAEYATAQKSYGATAYYNQDVSTFEADAGKDYTFFVKFNIENYNEIALTTKATAPIAIFHHNWSFDDGAPLAAGGFAIFADKDGELYLNTPTEKKKLNFNIKKDTKLYKDISDDLKFEKLEYQGSSSSNKRDGREQFLIFSFHVKSSNNQVSVKMKTLEQMIHAGAVVTQVKSFDEINFSSTSATKAFKFGGLMKRANLGSGLVNLEDPLGGRAFIEVSDMLLYEDNLESKSIGSSNFQDLTMEYLYRKYLTDRDRKQTGYDQYFVTKY